MINKLQQSKKVTGTLNIQIYLYCPFCNEEIDLTDNPFCDDGCIYNLVMPKNECWTGACENFSKEYLESFGEDFKCPHCDRIVDVGEIIY